ncbi:MAG: signal peptidase I [Oligoflexia bacterium]|nr:signal peptidase I [Oligoflexia bacterium]
MTNGENRNLTRDYGITIAVTVVVSLLIRIFVIEAYRIPTLAMRPTLEPGDIVFAVKWPRKEPKRGDLVLYSPDELDKRDYIKRVIAIPGETVEIRKGSLLVDGKSVAQRIQDAGCGTEGLPADAGNFREHGVCLEPPVIPDAPPTAVPSGSVYVLGDLRTGSQILAEDRGKSWGVIPASTIKGRVLCIWLSVDGGSRSWFPKFRFDRMFRELK